MPSSILVGCNVFKYSTSFGSVLLRAIMHSFPTRELGQKVKPLASTDNIGLSPSHGAKTFTDKKIWQPFTCSKSFHMLAGFSLSAKDRPLLLPVRSSVTNKLTKLCSQIRTFGAQMATAHPEYPCLQKGHSSLVPHFKTKTLGQWVSTNKPFSHLLSLVMHSCYLEWQ